jgi:pimeloyl-ACP methyl ester carboxylesterase
MGLTITWLELCFEFVNYTFIIYKVNRKTSGDFPFFFHKFPKGLHMSDAKIGDIQLHYEEYGEGPPLIMILGLGQDTATWEFQISDFSEHFRLILLDNRDSGKSSTCSETYTTETMAGDILGLMDHLGLARTHLLGTSMGGMIAQQVALMAPERVISLVLASTTS